MKTRVVLPFALAWTLVTTPSWAAPCQGRGTAVFFGNGMFTDRTSAWDDVRALKSALGASNSSSGDKRVVFDLAYNENESLFTQLFEVASQKELDDFEKFWTWVGGWVEAPEWFASRAKILVGNRIGEASSAYPDLFDHLEQYAGYAFDGYNIVLISHSQGNFYANRVAARLADYVDASLTGSINDKRKESGAYPEIKDLFANIQVATPVSATYGGAPWVTFWDDLVIDFVRETAGALPGNVSSTGRGMDWMGHDFEDAYLKTGESKELIQRYFHEAFTRLRYPIATLQPALEISQVRDFRKPIEGKMSFEIRAPDGKEVSGYDDASLEEDVQIQMTFADCLKITPGISTILAETYVPDSEHLDFEYTVAEDSPSGEMANKRSVRFRAGRGGKRWEIGTIETEFLSEKEPLRVRLNLYPEPKPR